MNEELTELELKFVQEQLTVAIIGGGHAAVRAAEVAREYGHQVVVIDRHAFLGGSLAASRHCWLKNGSCESDIPLPTGALKRDLYVRVRDAGVTPLLQTACAGVLCTGIAVCGLLLASKFGVRILPVDAIIDASEDQTITNHLLGPLEKRAAIAELIFEVDQAQTCTERNLNLKTWPNLSLHRTLREGTLAVSMSSRIDYRGQEDSTSQLSMRMRQAAVQVFAEMRANYPCFAQSRILSCGDVRLSMAPRIAAQRMNLETVPGNVDWQPTTCEIRELERSVEPVVAELCSSLRRPGLIDDIIAIHSHGRSLDYRKLSEAFDEELGLRSLNCEIRAPGGIETSVLLAGGGTGGGMALAALHDEGTEAMVVDTNLSLGGTSTVGLVTGAWHGYQDGAWAKRNAAIRALAEKEHSAFHFAAARYWDKIFLQDTRQLFYGASILCGAAQDKGRVEHALIYGEAGFRQISAELYIDTTADADLCYQAGIAYELGDPETGFIQSSSQWGADPWPTKNFQHKHYLADLDVVDPDSYADCQRGLGLAYRHNSDYHIADMFTQRESRRVVGEYSLNLRDIACRRQFKDVIAVALCLCDNHGRMSSDLVTAGLLGSDLYDNKEIRVRIPLRAFIPKGVKNVLVGAKALSGERDATCLCRMNPDISNAGYALGMVAAAAVAAGRAPGVLPLRSIQAKLRTKKLLPPWADDATPAWTGDFALKRLRENADSGYFPAMMLTDKDLLDRITRLLPEGGRVAEQAAMALAWHGRSEAFPVLAAMLARELPNDAAWVEDRGGDGWILRNVAGEKFNGSERSNYGKPQLTLCPNWRSHELINSLIFLLAKTGDARAVELLLPLLDRADAGGDELSRGSTPYSRQRLDVHRSFFHERLWALAQAWRLMPDQRAVPGLSALLDKKWIGGFTLTEAWADVPPFQLSYLEVMLATALLACGGELGRKRLDVYSNDARTIFRNMARRLLAKFAAG
jgi:hypothetical protein